jgi:hypothetical protein
MKFLYLGLAAPLGWEELLGVMEQLAFEKLL